MCIYILYISEIPLLVYIYAIRGQKLPVSDDSARPGYVSSWALFDRTVVPMFKNMHTTLCPRKVYVYIDTYIIIYMYHLCIHISSYIHIYIYIVSFIYS